MRNSEHMFKKIKNQSFQRWLISTLKLQSTQALYKYMYSRTRTCTKSSHALISMTVLVCIHTRTIRYA